jgi:hypothetical protein
MDRVSMDREVWRLRLQIAWMRALLALVGIPGITTPRPEIHWVVGGRAKPPDHP